jgi:RNA polymerase sigma-70 factor (ECF subfamily)
VSSFAESAFRRHHRAIHRFILGRVRDRDRADDVAQQVFVDALTTLESAQPPEGSALAWLYTVASRRLADEGRRRTRDRALVSRLDPPASVAPHEYGDRLGHVLGEAVAALPRGWREVLVRRLLHGQPFPELARELGLSEAAAKMRYIRALRQLRTELEQRGLDG